MRYAILAVAILLALHGCLGAPQGGNQTGNQTNTTVNNTGNQTINQTGNQTPPQGNQTGAGLTEELCNGAGGHWNTQGTCCRDLQPGQVCNKLCVAVCDCGGIAGFRCPSGYYCTDYYPNSTTPDAMGICQKNPKNQTGDLTEEACREARGNWNAQTGECQCGGFAGFGCPAGYACGDYYPDNQTADAMGVCKKLSN